MSDGGDRGEEDSQGTEREQRAEATGSDDEASAADGPERDPFGLLEDSVGDREGDPFDTLDDPAPDEDSEIDGDVDSQAATGTDSRRSGASVTPETKSSEPHGEDRSQPAADSGSDGRTTEGEGAAESDFEEVSEPAVRPGAPSLGGEGSADGEAGGAASAADPADGDRGDPFAGESTFQEMDVGEIDEDEVWRQISDAQARGSVTETGTREYADVSKHRYCERCEHFTAPPEVGCTNEGTEILEFVDNDTVRVADCPIVAERRALRRESE